MKRLRNRLIAATAAAVVVGSLWIGASASHFPLSDIDFDRGREIFDRRCSSCHSVDPSARSSFGPNLSRIGRTAADRVPGESAEQYLVNAIVSPAAFRPAGVPGVMPADIAAGLSADDIVSLAGFLMTNGGEPRPRQLMQLAGGIQTPPASEQARVDFAQVEAGRRLFLGKAGCVQCHPLQALPGHNLRAPSLALAGLHEREYLEQSIRDPNHVITAGYATWQAWLVSGRVVTGRLLAENDRHVELLTEEAGRPTVVVIARSEIDIDEDDAPMLFPTPQSLMPSGLPQQLGDEEIAQLVAFLRTLRSEPPR